MSSKCTVYIFFIKGSTNIAAPGNADIELLINSVADMVDKEQNIYRDTFLFQLAIDDVIQINLVNTNTGEVLDIEFFGYKI